VPAVCSLARDPAAGLVLLGLLESWCSVGAPGQEVVLCRIALVRLFASKPLKQQTTINRKPPLSRPCLVRAPSVPASFCFLANIHSFSFVFLSRLHIVSLSFLHRRHPHPRCRIEQRLLDSCNPALTEKSISCISTRLPSLRPRVLTATTAATFRPPPPPVRKSTSTPSLPPRHSC
jgi:hypothetical protein